MVKLFSGDKYSRKLRDIDGLLRNRPHYCIWTDWKVYGAAENMNTKKIKTHELNPNAKGKT
jgi:hypothetical protein